MKKVKIFSDGACSGNPGAGGWAAILQYKRAEKEISGAVEYTTNNRMELTAIIQAFELLKEPCEVTVFSDSAYVCNAFQKGWLESWSANDWKTSSKKGVENVDLWKQLLNNMRTHKVRYEKVPGHADNELNNRCDKLARAAVKSVVKSLDSGNSANAAKCE